MRALPSFLNAGQDMPFLPGGREANANLPALQDAELFDRRVDTLESPPAGGGRAKFHPFQVLKGATGDGYARVALDSLLFSPLAAANEALIAISNLNTDFAIGDTYFLYLHCTVSALAVSAAEIMAGYEANLIIMSGATQTDFYVPLAKIRSTSGGAEAVGVKVGENLWTHQRTFTHLRVFSLCIDGNPAIYALPV